MSSILLSLISCALITADPVSKDEPPSAAWLEAKVLASRSAIVRGYVDIHAESIPIDRGEPRPAIKPSKDVAAKPAEKIYDRVPNLKADAEGRKVELPPTPSKPKKGERYYKIVFDGDRIRMDETKTVSSKRGAAETVTIKYLFLPSAMYRFTNSLGQWTPRAPRVYKNAISNRIDGREFGRMAYLGVGSSSDPPVFVQLADAENLSIEKQRVAGLDTWRVKYDLAWKPPPPRLPNSLRLSDENQIAKAPGGKPEDAKVDSGKAGATHEVWIAPARNHSIVRRSLTHKNGEGKPEFAWTTVCEYAAHGGGEKPIWFPQVITYETFDKGILKSRSTATVTRAEFNGPVPEKVLTLAGMGIPKGTRLIEWDRAEATGFFSGAEPMPIWDGEKIVEPVEKTAAGGVASMGAAAAPPAAYTPPPDVSKTLRAPLVVLCVGLIGFLVWRRTAGRRREPRADTRDAPAP